MTLYVNYEFWVIMIVNDRVISYNKCATLMGDVDKGEGYLCLRWGHMGNLYTYPSIFHLLKVNIKMVLKIKS